MAELTRLTSSTGLLARILDTPNLMARVQALPSETVAAVIQRVGLADAGEILALVSQQQLLELFDADLWSAEGDIEQLSRERLSTWLEVLAESGADHVADRLAALPPDLLAHALESLVLVLDVDTLALVVTGQAPDDLLDKALSSPLSHELDQYLVLAKIVDGWDALLDAILALDARHPDVLRPIFDRLAAAAMDRVEEDGLYTVLNEAESLAEEAAGEREDRRARRGYVSRSDARAFVALDDDPEALAAEPRRDAIALAYFRRLEREAQAPVGQSPLDELLDRAGVTHAPQLTAGEPGADALRDAMQHLFQTSPELHAERLEELAFVTNAVISASDERRSPADAAHDVARICARAITWLEGRGREEPLRELSVDLLFRIGRAL
ncbi:MAG: hypothetical protein KC731_19470 [Myxococcales bacterium]|nr:hypothetical protein [Myxococcales bacterium]